MFFNRRKGKDKASAELVSMLFVIPIMFALIITLIDASILFLNRSSVESIARDSARTVAIVGGDGTATHGTPLENAYGMSIDDACDGLDASVGYKPSNSVIECTALKSLQDVNLIAVDVKNVTCGPGLTRSVGQEVSCKVEWDYNHIPGLSFINFGNENTTIGTSASEVNMSGISLLPRPRG